MFLLSVRDMLKSTANCAVAALDLVGFSIVASDFFSRGDACQNGGLDTDYVVQISICADWATKFMSTL